MLQWISESSLEFLEPWQLWSFPVVLSMTHLAIASWKFTGVCVNSDQRMMDKINEPIVRFIFEIFL